MESLFISSPIGNLKVSSQNGKIAKVSFCNNYESNQTKDENLTLCSDEFLTYFSGSTTIFNAKFDIGGSKFEKLVLNEIVKIPFGQTMTYSQIATLINKPKAVRAVANAVAKNKILLLIPCHRIVAKTSLGGYNAGIWRKIWLLRHEMKRLFELQAH